MRPFNNYENIETLREQTRLPIGGYIVRLLDNEIITYKQGTSEEFSVLNFRIDIIEGEYKDFYKNDYLSQSDGKRKWKGTYRLNIPRDNGEERDEMTMRIFKTTMVTIENSNPNYCWNWDEHTLNGKTVGAVFRNKEYEYNEKRGFFTECAGFRTIEQIRNGNFKIPADKLLDKTNTNGYFIQQNTYQEIIDDDCPFQ